jgi:poly-gamma-glutamate synthesis protein (capsule biosynthesis protein)
MIAAWLFAGCGAPGDGGSEPETDAPGGKADDLDDVVLGGPLLFDAACEPGDTLTIAAVGDVLLHSPLQRQAYDADDGFISLWSDVADLIAAADVSYANLEGPTARGVNSAGRDVPDPGKVFDGVVYASYPMFNYHPSLTTDLVASGFDVVSTSNNHSLDRRSLGADRTIEALEEAGLPFTGTRRSDGSGAWHTYTEEGGFRLAWVGCTYGTNGIPDNHGQVRNCYDDEDEIVAQIGELSQEAGVDAVIVTPHWGAEYTHNPADRDILLAHRFIDAGAVAVIGAHPHVLQPWERYVTDDGREGFVVYSLGNFVSNQSQLARRSTILLYLGLKRRGDGSVVPYGARYVPLVLDRSSGRHLVAIDREGGAASERSHITGLFGEWGVAPPVQDPDLAPQCDPDWVAPHPADGWIGGACADVGDDACGGTTCEASLPGGMCTQSCERTCPDQSGRPGTLCVDLPDLGPHCVIKCTTDGDCRDGYQCVVRTRPDGTGASNVCVPA